MSGWFLCSARPSFMATLQIFPISLIHWPSLRNRLITRTLPALMGSSVAVLFCCGEAVLRAATSGRHNMTSDTPDSAIVAHHSWWLVNYSRDTLSSSPAHSVIDCLRPYRTRNEG